MEVTKGNGKVAVFAELTRMSMCEILLCLNNVFLYPLKMRMQPMAIWR